MNNNDNTQKPIIRAGLKDIWNAYMLHGASYSIHDIPFCPTTSLDLPNAIITYDEAITIFNKHIISDKNFFYDSYVCFYMDDDKFDGPRGIWNKPRKRSIFSVTLPESSLRIFPHIRTFQSL